LTVSPTQANCGMISNVRPLGPSKASLQIQSRDLAVLCGLFESRLMTIAHISSLYFSGRREAAKKRLQKLKSAGLVAEYPRRTFDQSVLVLTSEALQLLHGRGVLRGYPAIDLAALERRARVSAITLRHELAVMDVKAALCSAITKTPTLSVIEFTTWPLLNQFAAAGILVKPDGFIRIREQSACGRTCGHCFFLEVDRSTEVQSILAGRARLYLTYYRSGDFAKRNGAPRTAYREHPFRVLFVLQTEERRNNLAEGLLAQNPPILNHVWLTTASEATVSPLGSIWIRPADYRKILPGMPNARIQFPGDHGYRRQADRDAFVAATISKTKLIG
jgi:Replication-relaxation